MTRLHVPRPFASWAAGKRMVRCGEGGGKLSSFFGYFFEGFLGNSLEKVLTEGVSEFSFNPPKTALWRKSAAQQSGRRESGSFDNIC